MTKPATWIVVLAALVAMVWLGWPSGARVAPSSVSPADGAAPASIAGDAAAATNAQPITASGDDAAAKRTAARTSVAFDAPGAIVRGRCVDQAGAPVAGCTVELRARPATHKVESAPYAEPAAAHMTDASGEFALRVLPDQTDIFAIDIRAPWSAPMTTNWAPLARDDRVDLGDVVVSRGTRIVGRVVDQAGMPQANARVTIGNRRRTPQKWTAFPIDVQVATTRADGRFELTEPVDAGHWVAEVDGHHLLSGAHLTVPSAASAIDAPMVVRTDAGGPSPGKATVAGTLTPIALIAWPTPLTVQLRRPDDPTGVLFPGKNPTVGPDGTFRITHVPPGNWTLVLVGEGSRRAIAAVDDLRSGETRMVSVDLPDLVPGTLRGEVLMNGQPFHGTLGVTGEHGIDAAGQVDRSGIVVETTDGRFVVRARPGTWTVTAHARTKFTTEDRVIVGIGQTLDARFRLASGTADLRLVRADGSAIPGLHLELRAGSETRDTYGPSDAEGRIRVIASPGSYVLAMRPRQARGDRDAKSAIQIARELAVLIDIGTIDVPSAREVVLTVPTAAGY